MSLKPLPAAANTFSRTAERLLRNQSTVSLQLKRLEDVTGARLFDRTPRSVRLTAAGEQLLGHAQRLLVLHDEALRELREPPVMGLVRLGTPEDFATSHLPHVLSRFARAYPRVALEVTCDLTLNLLDRFRRGEFDMVLIKRELSGERRGVPVWREPLVWVGEAHLADSEQLPLAVSPEPCVYRKRAVDALDRARRRWRVVYSCASLAGQHAAVRAGLGVTVLPKDMVPPGLVAVERRSLLPDLHDTEIALLARRGLSAPARRLHDHIVRSLESEAGLFQPM
ncbi:MAG: LysR family transcriptional regulator [Proteobacteria bacterium]|nr:LysR family transcriptional regulator [Pseudomonadota bacterium]